MKYKSREKEERKQKFNSKVKGKRKGSQCRGMEK
jgi:hypothetical protein